MSRDVYMSETELMEEITNLCDEFGLRYHHDTDSRRVDGQRGFPDLEIVGPGGIIHREVKNRANQPTDEQRAWGRDINQAGGDWQLWRPHDLLNGTIGRQLARVAGLVKSVA